MKQAFPMFLDSFGKFLKFFFVQKHILPLLKKGARTLILPLSQKYSSLWISLAKIA